MTKLTDAPFVDGRDRRGRFAKGNPGGPGNPHARRVAKLRSALLSAVTEEDLIAVVRELVDRARAGDIAATKVLLDRLFGPPEAPDVRARREREERRRAELDERFGL